MKRTIALFSAGILVSCAGSSPHNAPKTAHNASSPAYRPSGAAPSIAATSEAAPARRIAKSGYAPAPAPMAADSAGASAPAPARARRSASKAPSAAYRTAPAVRTPAGMPAPTKAAPVRIAQAHAKLLTAASVADVDRFQNYLRYLQRRSYIGRQLGVHMNRRLRVQVLDAKGKAINGATIQVHAGQYSTVVGTTHADGYWDFFPSVSAPSMFGRATITVTAGQQSKSVRVNLPRYGDGGTVAVRLSSVSALPARTLDLGFVIDVTGSMGDELRYVNREVADIVRRVKKSVPNTRVRVGAVFYRDRQDSMPLQKLAFTSDIQSFRRSMTSISASGGGDYPEDMNAGLATALRGLRWSQGNAVRVMVLLADAPPKYYADAQYRYLDAMKEASKRGIRILPVAASGANRSVEYLFRAMGAFTSTPYTYLTNDSGVGGHHMEADTDRVGVESFNDLLTRLIISDLQGKGMHEPGMLGPRGQNR
jgi:hypothetical protein